MTIVTSFFKQFQVNLLKPFGVELLAVNPTFQLEEINSDTLKRLIIEYKIVIIRNLNSIPQTDLVKYAEGIGPLLSWDFGVVMDMRVQEKPKNYLFTHDHVPFHWDGAFHQEPRYLLFHCVEAPFDDCGGETLFTNTHKIWLNANESERFEWNQKKIRYKTEKLAHYGGEINVPLVQKHPDTNEMILRFAEPVQRPMLNPVEISIDGLDSESTKQWIETMTSRCYQKEYCYIHSWKNNDVLLADNFTLIHARRAFKKFTPRFLRRIQIL